MLAVGRGSSTFSDGLAARPHCCGLSALLVVLTTGVLVRKATKNVSVVEIGQFLAERATIAATEVRTITNRHARTAE